MPLAGRRYSRLTLRVRRPRAPEQIEHTRPKRVGIGPVHAKRVDLVQKVSFEGGVTVAVVARRQVGFDRRHVRLPERSIVIVGAENAKLRMTISVTSPLSIGSVGSARVQHAETARLTTSQATGRELRGAIMASPLEPGRRPS